MKNLSPEEWHNLLEKMLNDDELFQVLFRLVICRSEWILNKISNQTLHFFSHYISLYPSRQKVLVREVLDLSGFYCICFSFFIEPTGSNSNTTLVTHYHAESLSFVRWWMDHSRRVISQTMKWRFIKSSAWNLLLIVN